MDCSLRGSSIHEIFQAKVLEWVSPNLKANSKCGVRNEPGEVDVKCPYSVMVGPRPNEPRGIGKNGGRRGASASRCRGNFQHKLSMRRPMGFLTNNLNGNFPEIRVHGAVTRTRSQNRHQDYEHRGWMGLLGHPLQFLFSQMDPESQLGDLSDARDHWGHWNPHLFPLTIPASAICPEGWSSHMWGPTISRDSYEHPCCTAPGVLFIRHYTWTAFTLKHYVRGFVFESGQCKALLPSEKLVFILKLGKYLPEPKQARRETDWAIGKRLEPDLNSTGLSSLYQALYTEMRYPAKLCPNCRLIRKKMLSWATKFGVVCYVAVASWNLPWQASFSLISIPGYLSDSPLQSYREKSFHPVESFQTPGESKGRPSSMESYFTLPTDASPLMWKWADGLQFQVPFWPQVSHVPKTESKTPYSIPPYTPSLLNGLPDFTSSLATLHTRNMPQNSNALKNAYPNE